MRTTSGPTSEAPNVDQLHLDPAAARAIADRANAIPIKRCGISASKGSPSSRLPRYFLPL